MYSATSRVLFSILFSLGTLCALAGEDNLGQPIFIQGEVGLPLEYKLALDNALGIQKVKGLQLPAGLRMASDGTVVGTPLAAGDSTAQAIMLDIQNLLVQQQELLISVKNGNAGAGARSIGSSAGLGSRSVDGIMVSSDLFASPNPAPVNSTVTLTVGATENSGKALTYGWDFGDGSNANTSSGSTTHSYSATGSYTVNVNIGNGSDLISATTAVSVVEQDAAGSRSISSSTTPITLSVVGATSRSLGRSSVSANPFDSLQLSGSFDPTNHHYMVGFVVAKGKKASKTKPATPDTVIKVPVLADTSSSSALSVMVPPFLKANGYSSGTAATKLYTDGIESDISQAVKIMTLPKVKAQLGVPTISYLQMSKQLLVTARPTLASSAFIGGQTLTDLDAAVSSLNSMIADLIGATTGKTKDKLALAMLKQSDNMVFGILSGGTKAGDSTFAAACTAWLSAFKTAKDSSDATLIAAENAYANAIFAAAGATGVTAHSIAGRGFMSKAIGYTLGILTVTGAGVATVATAVGGTAAFSTVMVPIGAAALVIGTTAAVTTAVIAGTAAVVGIATGNQATKDLSKTMVKESAQIGIDTAVNGVTQNLPLGQKIITKLVGGKLTSNIVEDICNQTGTVSNSTVTIQNTVPQSSGSFSAGIIPSGDSYYIVVQGKAGDSLTATVNGTDGYSTSFSGVGSITSSTIPAGAPGVTDTITCTDTVTGESQSFHFNF